MRDMGAIRQKLKQAQYRHLKRVLCERFPSNEEWPREEVEKIKSEHRTFFATASLAAIARDFPDVAALMWVLEDQPDQPLVINGTLVGRIGGVMIWADTNEDADHARCLIDRIVDAATSPTTLPEPIQKSWWQRWLFG
jgi:hypothetical protein